MVMLWAGPAAARAVPLRLIGELSVTNDDGTAGGLEFTLSVIDSEGGPERLLGETLLAPTFWPEVGQTFTGSFAADFVTPGPGLIETDPLRVDGIRLYLELAAPTGNPGPMATHIRTWWPPTDLGVPATNDVDMGPLRDPPPWIVGEATIRVDAVVPEPAGGVMAVLLVALGLRRKNGKVCGRPKD